MKYLYFKTRRNFWTLIAKVSATIATKIKSTIPVNLLEYALNKRAIALSDEATYCMIQVTKWQSKAKRCVLAHKENEKAVSKKDK